MTQVIGFSGKLQSGKDTLTNWLHGVALVDPLKLTPRTFITEQGQLMVEIAPDEFDLLNLDSKDPVVVKWLAEKVWPHVRSFSCAEALKDFCTSFLGLSVESVWGTNEQKNEPTHLRWENMPGYAEYVDQLLSEDKSPPENEFMTGREVLEYVGTQIFRKIDPDIHAKKLLEYIAMYSPALAIAKDVRFPNEVDAIHSVGGKVIRLTRVTEEAAENDHESNVALDDYEDFDYVLDNDNLTIDETCALLHDYLLYTFPPPPPAPNINRTAHVL